MSQSLLSPLDESRFGVKTLKTDIKNLNQFDDALKYAEDQNVSLAIIRISTSQLDIVQEAEAQSFQLMDTLLYYQRHLKHIPKDIIKAKIVLAQESDVSRIKDIAAKAFKNYYGHYHADPRLKNSLCDQVYTSWAEAMCLSKDEKDEVLCVITEEKEAMGFAALRQISERQGEGVLFAVDPEFEGRGLYWALMTASLNHYKKKKCTHMLISTQITNTVVQKTWAALGFELSHSYYTFHKWLN